MLHSQIFLPNIEEFESANLKAVLDDMPFLLTDNHKKHV